MKNPRLFFLCFCLVLVGMALLLGAAACSSNTTPTPPVASPTTGQAGPTVAPRTLPPATIPVAQPTAVVLPTAAVTPTVPIAAATATRSARPATTAPPAPPKASALAGKLAYSVVTDAPPQFHSIWVAKADGTGASKILDAASWPAFSADGKRLAFYQLGIGGKNTGIYVGDASGGNPAAAVINAGACCFHWSNDGNWIVYTLSNKVMQPGGPIHMIKVDGVFKTTIDLKVVGNGPSFSPDGKQVIYSGCEPGTSTCGIRSVAADGSGVARYITKDNGGNGQWSPRGDKIVYQADDGAGHMNVFVVNPDGSGRKQLTTGKGNDGQPVWSRDGSSIFWRSDQNRTAWAIYAMNADGSNQRRIIANVPPDPVLWGWESLSFAP